MQLDFYSYVSFTVVFIFGYALSNRSEWWYRKESRTQAKFFSKFFILPLEPKQYNCVFLCKNFSFKSYLLIHKFDIVCLSETYLDTSVPLYDINLEIQGYELIWSDHPSQHKRGGVCIYFRNSVPLKILNIHYLKKG